MKVALEGKQEEQSSAQARPASFIGRSALLNSTNQHLLNVQHARLDGNRGRGKR